MEHVVYHWTHKRNLPSIAAVGLSDDYARTRDGYLYGVPCQRILSGLRHVTLRHAWVPEDLVCLAFKLSDGRRAVVANRRVYKFRGVIPPADLSVIRFYWPAESFTDFYSPGKPRPVPRRKPSRNTGGRRR